VLEIVGLPEPDADSFQNRLSRLAATISGSTYPIQYVHMYEDEGITMG